MPLNAPAKSWDSGVAYLPADRHGEGLMMTMSVRENMALSSLPQLARLGVMQRDTEAELVEQQPRCPAATSRKWPWADP